MRLAMLGAGIAGAVSLLPLPASAQGPVEVVITNVRDSTGMLSVMLCLEPQWLKICPIKASAPARAGTTIVAFAGVPPGRYGAIAFHDRNRNGKADRNFLGIPTEDIGFSNNALKRLAPPRFADAAFQHAAEEQRLTFAMKRF
ncbi:Uncharacterized conserved protein, DUF2141 family [Novosphingobium sp. CF614]|uniref:DUF2141 domain-containing protein n=1 Tax=Novosphingobium sp. CF614 TaxID=1884364 RepID=UPI0008E21AF4|nr:DUF2141 domain-containing protein [Novosphingobium sp. CF614]SFG00702.1 Uncharacterized conserved protein, DUF2141 family [Novosphingobium sp. CF614]